MKKVDPTVIKETKYIAFWVLIFSLITQAVFLIIGKWDLSVLLGNLLTGSFGILNFFLMGLTVQSALSLEEKEAKTKIKVSQIYRNIMMLAVVALGVLLPVFSTWTVIIPVVFPRLAIAIRPLTEKGKK